MASEQRTRGILGGFIGTGTALLVLATVVAAARLPARQLQEAETYRLHGDAVAVYNLAGSVSVVAGEGDAVVVEVRRSGPEADRLSVETGSVEGRQALRILYPGDRVVYPDGRGETEVRVRDDGTFDGSWDGGGRRVEVSARGSGLEAHADLTVRVPRDRILDVQLAAGTLRAEGVRGQLTLDTHTGRIEARDLGGEISLDTGSGSVDVRSVDGDLEVDTGSGSVAVSDVSGDEVGIDTGSGRVRGSGFDVEQLTVDTGSGGIDLEGVAARRLSLDTGSGRIRVALVSDVDQLTADTGSGGVTLIVPEDFGAELSLEAGSGDFVFDVPVEIHSHEDGEFEGRIGDGRGRVEIDTGSGGVRIRGG